MKTKSLLRLLSSIVFQLLFIFIANSQPIVQQSMTFRGYIDGSDYVHIDRDKVWYVHRTGQYPGKWNPSIPNSGNLPTYINGNTWYPVWNYGDGTSNFYTSLNPMLPFGAFDIAFVKLEGRGYASFEMIPAEYNDFHTRIIIDDDGFVGPSWYEFRVSWKVCNPPAPVLPINGNSSVCRGDTIKLSNSTPGGIWSSNNTSVATIDVNGVVSGITAGTATITYAVTTCAPITVTKIITVNAAGTCASNTNLSNLELSTGIMNPAFSPSVTNYTALVERYLSSIRVTPTLSNLTSTVKVNGVVVPSGSPSSQIPLYAGPNNIIVEVKAQDQSTKSYNINVSWADYSMLTRPMSAASFPKEVLPTNAGRIEFYAKLTGYSGEIPQGGITPYLFNIQEGSNAFQLGFSSNDGAGSGGLVGLAGNQFRSGSAASGTYTYEQILGSSQVSGWHHYIFQWNKDGILSVDNGQRKVAIFIDGILRSTKWDARGLQSFLPFNACATFNLITSIAQGMVGGEVAIDEIKIFDVNNNLLLYNTLGSASEIANSAVGPNGTFNGYGNAHFVPGIAGNAIAATPIYSIGLSDCPVVCTTGSGGGEIKPNMTVCATFNTGTLALSGHVGNVVKWQALEEGQLNWIDIANNTTSLTFNNLLKTTQ